MWKNKELKTEAKKSLKSNYKTLLMMTVVLSFMGVLTNGSMRLANLQTGAESEGVVATSSQTTLESYLMSFATGDGHTTQIAHALMSSFKGTGGAIYSLMHLVDGIIVSNGFVAMLVVIASMIVFVLYNVFVKNLLYVGYMRSLLETKVYSKTPFLRIFVFLRKDGAWPIVKAMLLRDAAIIGCAVLSFLGLITVAVGITFNNDLTMMLVIIGVAAAVIFAVLTAYFWYSLIMVPFIVIMDKNVPVKTAFKMSMTMMKGNRMHAVGLDLSFIGWYILSAITMGLSDLFYTVAYRELTRAELFRVLRAKAISDQIDGFEILVDDMLDSNPDGLEHYPAKSRYDEARIVNYVRSMEPNRHYTLINLILCFFIFSCIGWCWEVALHIVRDGVFVNRGVNWGPWLPIYGAGGVMIILFLRRFSKLPGVLMALTFVLCGVVEYFTSWFLEVTKGMKWWDYSDHFMNLNGRICLEGLLTFALAGLLFVYIAGPGLDNWLNKFDNRVKVPVAICLCAIFGADIIYSHYYPNTGKGITAGMLPETDDKFISG